MFSRDWYGVVVWLAEKRCKDLFLQIKFVNEKSSKIEKSQFDKNPKLNESSTCKF